MRNTFIMVIVLTLVCIISALSLTLVNNITSVHIAEQKQKEKLVAVNSVLPKELIHYDNDLNKDMIKILEWTDNDGLPKDVFIAKKNGKPVGFAFTSTGEGYGGLITIMIGIDINDNIMGIEIIDHHETPGLGSKIDDPLLFKDQFKGKNTKNSKDGKLVIIKGRKAKDNWEIEALTGATISPMGVVSAVNDGLSKFRQFRDKMK